jgi:hypothetical protein
MWTTILSLRSDTFHQHFRNFGRSGCVLFGDLSLLSVTRSKIYFFSQRKGGFSPRSRKLSGVVPKPHSKACAAIDKLQAVRREIRITLEQSRHVKELLGGLLQSRFQQLPDDKVPVDGACDMRASPDWFMFSR